MAYDTSGWNWADTSSAARDAYTQSLQSGVNPSGPNGIWTNQGNNPYYGLANGFFDQTALKNLGYTGPMPTNQSNNVAGMGGDFSAASGLADWLSQNGYQYGTGVMNNNQYYGIRDKNGNLVGNPIMSGALNDPTGLLISTLAIGGFGGAMAAGGLGSSVAGAGGDAMGGAAGTLGAVDSQLANAAGIGAGAGAAPAAVDLGTLGGIQATGLGASATPALSSTFTSAYGSPATATGPGTQLAAGPGYTGMGMAPETAPAAGTGTFNAAADSQAANAAGVGGMSGGVPSAVDLGSAGGIMSTAPEVAPGLGSAVASAGGTGASGAAATPPITAPSVGQVAGGTSGLGSTIGNLLGGGNIGSTVGNAINSALSPQGLATLISMMNDRNQANTWQQQMDQLNANFSTNSPYAQQMAETLARKDAAAGRNSQYGPRAMELASNLATEKSKAMGNLIQMQSNANAAGTAGYRDLLSLLGSGGSGGSNSVLGSLGGVFNSGFNDLLKMVIGG